MSATCPNCQTPLRPAARFCAKCGAAINAPPVPPPLTTNPVMAPPSGLYNQPTYPPVSFPASPAPAKGTIQMASGSHPTVVAILLSILPGAGQLYNKQYAKGLLMTPVACILFFCVGVPLYSQFLRMAGGPKAITFQQAVGGLIMLLFAFVVGLIALAAVDAGRIASRLNRGEAVGKWRWF